MKPTSNLLKEAGVIRSNCRKAHLERRTRGRRRSSWVHDINRPEQFVKDFRDQILPSPNVTGAVHIGP
ncbi:hypothetical protein Q3G72_012691 [Acer saccharum]|nr:hypothetical protein Q3G72_012691 [Acer saccharum]